MASVRIRGEMVNCPKVMKMTIALKLNLIDNWLLESEASVRHEAVKLMLIGALVRFWSVAREFGKFEGDDLLFGQNLLDEDIDELAGFPGFCRVMMQHGWLAMDGDPLNDEPLRWRLPNFARHNKAITRVRLSSAEKQKRYRDRQRAEGALPEKVTRPVTRGNAEGICIKKKRTKKEDHPKEEESKTNTVRPRDELFDALAVAWGLDPLVKFTKSAAGRIAKAAKELRQADPPFGPDDVRKFVKMYHAICPWAKQDNRLPSPQEIATHIGKIRSNQNGKPPVKEWRPPSDRADSGADAQAATATPRSPTRGPSGQS